MPKEKSKQYVLDKETITSTSSTVEQKVIVSPYSIANKINVSTLYQKSLNDNFLSIASFKDGDGMHRRITHAIVYTICKDSQPISNAEGEVFGLRRTH
ncbi:hypothetical protein NPIL_584321 [Nephila pilipes]|uniref:Uncharacterized protein n=1 Tax=Nephila pilipes TaxID=299642 RepID=A0A8X6UBV1_NEPPI|nr:hypothetical protein NPIL_584321 [Nephila pilipes]